MDKLFLTLCRDWLENPTWPADNAVSLLLQVDPDDIERKNELKKTKAYRKIYSKVDAAVQAGQIEFVPNRGVIVEPFCKWCLSTPSVVQIFPDELREALRLAGKAERVEAGQLRQMVEPTRKDDWFHVIRDAVGDFEHKFGRTPNETQLWAKLIDDPPQHYGITFKDPNLRLPGAKPLDREAFHKRYQRFFPAKSGQ